MTRPFVESRSARPFTTLVIACPATGLTVASGNLTLPIFAVIAQSFHLPATDAPLAFSAG